MKRLVWLFLAVFCLALAQVQRVDLPSTKTETCPCCETPKACGMADCGQPPARASAPLTLEQPAGETRLAAKAEASAARLAGQKFYFSLFSPIGLPFALFPVSSLTAPLPVVPLFKAHCGFLV